MGHQGERDMTAPTVPMTHFILVQTRLALGFLNTLLDDITTSGYLGHLGQGDAQRCIGQEIGDVRGVTDSASRHEPGFWSWQTPLGSR